VKKIDKTKPDILRVTEFVLDKAGKEFSVGDAAKTSGLNAISDYRIGEILRVICYQPNGPDSIEFLTTINDITKQHFTPGKWQLNANTYFSYLSYISVQNSEKSNKLAIYSIWIASLALLGNILALSKDQLFQLIN
jgi:hypothetical protein